MSYIEAAKEKEDLSGYTDFEIATALHAQFEDETGQSVPFESFASDAGLALETKSIPVPQPADQTTADQLQSAEQIEPTGSINQQSIQPLPDHPGEPADIPKFSGLGVGLGEQQIKPPTLGEVLLAPLKSIPAMGKQVAGGIGQYAAESLKEKSLLGGIIAGELATPDIQQSILEGAVSIDQALKEASDVGGNLYAKGTAQMEALKPQGMTKLQEFVYDVGVAGTKMVPAVGVSVATQNPWAFAVVFYPDVFANKYGALRQQGIPADEATTHAHVAANIEVLTERIPIGILTKMGKPMVKRMIEATIGEGAQEAVSGLLQGLYDKATTEPDLTYMDIVKSAGYEGLVGTALGAGMGVATHPIIKMQEKITGKQLSEEIGALLDKRLTDAEGKAVESMKPGPATEEQKQYAVDTKAAQEATISERKSKAKSREFADEFEKAVQQREQGVQAERDSAMAKAEQEKRQEQEKVVDFTVKESKKAGAQPTAMELAMQKAVEQKKVSRESIEPASIEAEKVNKPSKPVKIKEAPASTVTAIPAKPLRPIDTENDDILKAIAKLGGINQAVATEQGIDPETFKEQLGGSTPVFRKNGGATLDDLAGALSQYGYISQEYTGNELLDKVSNALRGDDVLTPAGFEKKAERDYEERKFSDYQYDDFAGIEEELGLHLKNDVVQDDDKKLAAAIDNASDTLNDVDIEEILERTAIQTENDSDYNKAAIKAIYEAVGARKKDTPSSKASKVEAKQEEGFQLTATNQPQEISGKKPVEQDMFGGKTEIQQQLHDIKVEKQRKEQNAPSMEEGAGDLFTSKSKQTDIEDVTKKPMEAEVEPIDESYIEGVPEVKGEPIEVEWNESKPDRRKEPRGEVKPKKKIEDFGEKLGGARKDQAAKMRQELSDAEISTLPLSKIWPKSEVESISDDYVAAFAWAARAEIPRKPSAGHKKPAWVNTVKSYRGLMNGIFNQIEAGKLPVEKLADHLAKHPILRKFSNKVDLLKSIDRKDWGRIGSVAEYPDAYSIKDGIKTPTPFVAVEIDGRRERFDGAKSTSDIAGNVKEKLGETDTKTAAIKKMTFEVRGRAGHYFINKRGDNEYRELKTFTTAKEAQEYRRANHAALVEAWEKVKERDNVKKTDVRKKENKPRTGQDYRKGKDVTPSMFRDTFGFRGVEFGNWVAQGKNAKERQGMLNQAYDALLDLSNIVGIPAEAVSLNGTLGLGFGSRGHGWASAHYEPGNLVINLTKTRGAGSLAHEWFHALDNFFQKKRGQGTTRDSMFITYSPETYYQHKTGGYRLSAKEFEGAVDGKTSRYRIRNKEDWTKIDGVRPEVGEAFADLVNTLNKSPMRKRSSLIDKGKADGYWSRILERAARSFENYVIAKMGKGGYDNDYLANVVTIEEFKRDPGRFPYLLDEEVAPVEEAFDKLFKTIKTKKTSAGTTLYANPIQPIMEAYSKAAKKVTAKLERVFAPMSALGRLPNQRVYLKDRYITLGRIAQVEDIAQDINKTFLKATERDKQAVYDFLTTAKATPAGISDQTIRAKAQQVKGAIRLVGDRLVDRGIIPAESHDEYRDAYLPRVYLKYALGEGALRELGMGKTISPQGYTKKRVMGDTPEEKRVRDVVLGEITDPGYLAARAISIPGRDLAVLDFLTTISEHEEWIYEPYLTGIEEYIDENNNIRVRPGDDKQASVFWIENEADRLAKQAVHMTPEAAAKTELLAKDYRALSEGILQQTEKPTADFKQLPNTPRYGPLRGLYVRKEIYSDLVGQASFGDVNTWEQRLMGQSGILTRYTQFWKMAKVGFNYPSQVRNFVSNGVLLNTVGGVPMHSMPSVFIKTVKDLRSKGKYSKIANKYGVRASTFSNNEMLRIERHFLRTKAQHAGGFSIAQLVDYGAAFANFHGDLYQASESLFKTAKILYDMEYEGKSEEEAALGAHEALFDYSLIPGLVRYLRNAPIGIPFLTFYFKATGAIAKSAIEHPGRYLPYVAIPWMFAQAWLYANQDFDDDDLKTLKASLPKWLQERGGAYFMPYRDDNGRWQAVQLGYFFPWQMHVELFQEAAKGQAGDMLGTTGLLGGPIPDMISAVKTGIDPFTRREIYNENDPPAKQMKDLLAYLWRLNAPSYMTDVGALGHIMNSLSGYKDTRKLYYGEEKYTLAQSITRLFGVNIYPVDAAKSRASNLRQMTFELRDFKARAKRTLRDPNFQKQGKKKVKEYMDWYVMELTARALQMQEYAQKTKGAERLSNVTN